MKTMNATMDQIFLTYGYVNVPSGTKSEQPASHRQIVGTFLSNLAYYGYVPSKELVGCLMVSPYADVVEIWSKLEKALKANSGAGRDIGKYIVYKNFPKEVLEMSQAEYWFKQILMYIGFANEYFTQEEIQRDAMFEAVTLKVLHVAKDTVAADIFGQLMSLPARWTDAQESHAQALMSVFAKYVTLGIDLDSVGFKENGVKAILYAREKGLPLSLTITTATDVLRLAAGMSGADVSLREAVKFKKFKRAERRFLLSFLETAKNLEDDFAARPDLWKKFMMVAHPGDYASFVRVNAAYDKLYNGQVKSFAAKVDPFTIVDLNLLSTRPGEFLRRFHSMYAIFRKEAVDAFVQLLPKLSTYQLVKFRKYLETINTRKQLVYPPRGNWSKLQIVNNQKKQIDSDDLRTLDTMIGNILAGRLSEVVPEGVNLDVSADYVKLQTNDQKLASYGRGTSFPIPEEIKFIRSASYWGAPGRNNTWMDNGWNFFDANWQAKGSICWNRTDFRGAAVFSGDPTSSKTVDGKACQMIDLYIDKLVAMGIRYAVWNILSFNDVSFDSVNDIFASLQWGVDAQKGKVYEPSRAQMEFPITGQNKTKYIAYIDLVERKLVYMDANFKGAVSSAAANEGTLQSTMPAFIEYLDSLPSVYDLFQSAPAGSVPVTFSDVNQTIEDGKAYVFRPENPDNKFDKLDLNAILS